MEFAVCLPTVELLADHVRTVLCTHEHLDPVQTPMEQSLITRAGRPCGLFFQVKGPRRVCTYAVWAGEENKLLFYDSNGQRFAQERLAESPDPLKLA